MTRLWHLLLFILSAAGSVCLHHFLKSEAPLSHAALLLLPYGLVSMIEWFVLRPRLGRFLFVRLLSVCFGMAVFVLAFFSYMAFSSHASFLSDTLFFIGSAAAGSALSYSLSSFVNHQTACFRKAIHTQTAFH